MGSDSPREYYVYHEGVFYESWYGYLEETSDFLLDLLLPYLAEIPFPVVFQLIGPKPDDGNILKHLRAKMVQALEASPCDFVLQVESLLENSVLAFPSISIEDLIYEQYEKMRSLISSRSKRLDFLKRVLGVRDDTVVLRHVIISINSEPDSPSYYLRLLCPEYMLLSKSGTKLDSYRVIDLRPVNKAIITDEEASLPEINLRISTFTEESSAFGPCLLTY